MAEGEALGLSSPSVTTNYNFAIESASGKFKFVIRKAKKFAEPKEELGSEPARKFG